MVMLQDCLRGPLHEPSMKLGHTPSRPTNKNLIRLLDTTFGITLHDTYGTNLFPFVKLGGMSVPIHQADLVAAARQFALPQIRIINPWLVISLDNYALRLMYSICSVVIRVRFKRGSWKMQNIKDSDVLPLRSASPNP